MGKKALAPGDIGDGFHIYDFLSDSYQVACGHAWIVCCSLPICLLGQETKIFHFNLYPGICSDYLYSGGTKPDFYWIEV